MAWFLVLPLILSLWICFDANYFVRATLMAIMCTVKRSKRPPHWSHECVTHGICLTTDLDFMLHMNNARYLRECDFARFDFFILSHLLDALKRSGTITVTSANNIRYRRSIHLFQRFYICTKLVYWDDKSFYLEQRIIRSSDNFLMAVNYSCQTVLNAVKPQTVLETLHGQVECPTPPAEIEAWIHFINLSRQAIRKLD